MTTGHIPAGTNHDGTEYTAPEALHAALRDWDANGRPPLPVTLADGLTRDGRPVVGQVLSIAETPEGLEVTMDLSAWTGLHTVTSE